MRPWLSLTILACALIGSACAQQFPPKTYDWVRASDETVQLDPADYHTGRVYRPGREGGNMHIIIRAKQPVSLAMTWAESWNTAQQHPETWSSLEYRCMREHVMSTTYECHLPPGQSMVLVIHDERTPDRAIVQGIEAILGKAGARQLISPNDVQITYHSWSCVANCIQPEFDWVRLVPRPRANSAECRRWSSLARLSSRTGRNRSSSFRAASSSRIKKPRSKRRLLNV